MTLKASFIDPFDTVYSENLRFTFLNSTDGTVFCWLWFIRIKYVFSNWDRVNTAQLNLLNPVNNDKCKQKKRCRTDNEMHFRVQAG